MVDTIQKVTGVVEQDPSYTQAGQVDRAKSPGRDKSPPGAPDASVQPGKREIPLGSAAEISKVVKDVNTLVHQVGSTKISFDVDEATGRSVIRVLDKESGEVIRQVPPEELLTLVARMRQLSGLIFSQEV